MRQCWARTKDFKRCKNPATLGSFFCHKHHGWKWLTRRWVWVTLGSTLVAITAFLANVVQITDLDIFKIKTPTVQAPPASEKLYYMTVVDASERMLHSINGSEQKWQVAIRSLHDKISLLPGGANFGLVAFGQENLSMSVPCEESAEVLVSVNDRTASEKPLTGYSQQRALLAVSQIKPGSTGSLTKAISLAVDQLVSGLPENYSKTIIVVTGGGDACNPQAEWDSLEFLLSGAINDVSVYTELIVFVTEEIKEEVAAKVQKIARLNKVTVSLPTTPEELNSDLENAVERAVVRGMEVDPAPFIAQETIVAATKVSQSVNANSAVPEAQHPIPPAQLVPTLVQSPPNTTALLPSPTPFVVRTNTSTLSLTSIPPTNTAIYFPPTIFPTDIPTDTATNAPPTPEPPSLPDVLYITDPTNGATCNCEKSADCTITVTVQWISDTQAEEQGLYLSVWVKPYPGNFSYQFSSQSEVNYLGNGLWQSYPVYIGQKDVDEPGTPFAIHAIIADQPYANNLYQSPLPPYTKEASIEIAR